MAATTRSFGRLSDSLLLLSITLVVLSLATPQWIWPVKALENGLARTPPMGWLAWERFTCQVDCERYPRDCINAQLFRQMADRMASDGWLERGYNYVHIDDCWSEMKRDKTTEKLAPDHKRFMAGIKALADYVHQHDQLKLGIYGDCGTSTCAGYPAQLRHNDSLRVLEGPFELSGDEQESSSELMQEDERRDEFIRKEATYFQLDAQTLAEWHVDSLKFDGCFVDPLRAETICSKMAGALEATRRPILLICEWPFYMMYTHTQPDFNLTASSCNVWRYYDDIEDSWLSILNTIDYTIKHQATILQHHGPGHWFDPDQLVIGNFGLSVAQARAQMAIWSVWAAPLYMSNDLRAIGSQFKAILQNERLISVNQDKLGVFGQMVAQNEGNQLQAFIKPVLPITNNCPSFAIVYLNRKTLGNRQKVAFKVSDLLLSAPIRQAAANEEVVRQYESKQQGEEQDLDLGMLFSETTTTTPETQEEDQEGAIDANTCLQRLKKASKAARGSAEAIEFELIDLLDSQQTGEQVTLSASDTLELWVRPNDVRAIKLVERD